MKGGRAPKDKPSGRRSIDQVWHVSKLTTIRVEGGGAELAEDLASSGHGQSQQCAGSSIKKWLCAKGQGLATASQTQRACIGYWLGCSPKSNLGRDLALGGEWGGEKSSTVLCFWACSPYVETACAN